MTAAAGPTAAGVEWREGAVQLELKDGAGGCSEPAGLELEGTSRVVDVRLTPAG